MSALSLVGSGQHSRARRPRADVFYIGAGAAPQSTSPWGFGKPPPLRHRPRGACLAEQAGPVETVWVRCHICAQMFGNPAIVVHEPQCFEKWRTRELAKPPSRRLRPPERPELTPGGTIEEYNVRAQESSDRCCLCPCPKCGRTFLPERLQAHVRSCEEEGVPNDGKEPHEWGPITEVGDGWSMEELERFCHRRRIDSGRKQYERDLGCVGERVKASGPVKRDRWDVNGLSKRELIAKINRNLQSEKAASTIEGAEAIKLEEFKLWLGEKITDKPLARKVFSARLVNFDR